MKRVESRVRLKLVHRREGSHMVLGRIKAGCGRRWLGVGFVSKVELVGKHKTSSGAARGLVERSTEHLVRGGLDWKGSCGWSLESRLRTLALVSVIVVEKPSLPEWWSRPQGWGAQQLPESSLYKGGNVGNWGGVGRTPDFRTE